MQLILTTVNNLPFKEIVGIRQSNQHKLSNEVAKYIHLTLHDKFHLVLQDIFEYFNFLLENTQQYLSHKTLCQ